MRDATDLTFRVDHGVEANLLATPFGIALFNAARLTEVDVAGEFAHNQDIQTRHHFRLQ